MKQTRFFLIMLMIMLGLNCSVQAGEFHFVHPEILIDGQGGAGEIMPDYPSQQEFSATHQELVHRVRTNPGLFFLSMVQASLHRNVREWMAYFGFIES
ncbi:hypothetical protein IPF37_01690 [bacterium]|nr:MAG: hypothetical protein IPF37_01690 [bacterium]